MSTKITGSDRPVGIERCCLDCLDEMLLDLTTQPWQAIPRDEMTRTLVQVCMVIQAIPDEAQRDWWLSELRRSLQQAFPDAKLFPSSIKMNLAIMLRSAKEGYEAWRAHYAPPLLDPERN
jgi:hypothetical protein